MTMHQTKKKDISKKHIGVLMGGCSSEKAISMKSGTAVVKALSEAGCNVSALELKSENREEVMDFLKAASIDIAFITLHGRFGEDGKIQEILEIMGLPYTGSGSAASRMAMDKLASYDTLVAHHIRVPQFMRFEKKDLKNIEEQVKSVFNRKPIVVKPPCEGSSFGIAIVHDYQDLPKAISDAFSYGDRIIVESYIKGKELTVGILGNKLLPVVEIRPKNSFFDYSAKYQAGLTEYIVPAEINSSTAQQVQQIAWKVHQAIGCRDLSRVDFILDEGNMPWVLEINTIPGMTATSLLPKAAAAVGIDFKTLCLTLAELAHE
ncbi:MAG: D-alanine--D-alanine ligase [Candidatus Omnitrophota bacterium]